MKTLSGIALVLTLSVPALAGSALAQDETLIGGDIESGGYGALVVRYGEVKGTDGVFVGGQGGWIINHSLVLGAGGYGLANDIGVGDCDCLALGVGYGGLLVEYIIAPRKLVHLSVQAIIGGGGVTYYDRRFECDYSVYDGDAFFVLEPAASLMLNLHRFVRVGIGGAYRYVDGVRYDDLTDSDLSGFSAQFTAKFGSF
jgi:hypothetical protein